MSDKILILDFGSQVTQLIARRVREAGVYCELHPFDMSADDIRAYAPSGIILSGSHASVIEEDTARAPQIVFELGAQIWIAVSVYVLIAIVKKRLKLEPTLYGLLQMLSLTLFEKTTLQDALQRATARENDRPSANQLNLF